MKIKLNKLAVTAILALVISGCSQDSVESTSGAGTAALAEGSITPISTATEGQSQAVTTGLDIPCNPWPSGSGQIWKPHSEGDGNLVVLLASGVPNIGVLVVDPKGNAVEVGRYVGHTNGNRATYRFSRPGRRFGAPSILRVGTPSGTDYCIPNPAARFD